MKHLILFFGLFFLCNGLTKSQDFVKVSKLNFEVSEFISASGFAPGTEMTLRINEENKKTIAFGLYYGSDYGKILGFTVNHEVFICRQEQNKIEPFVFYNFIYRINEISGELSMMTEGMINGKYKSLEHHLGMGLHIAIAGNLYLSPEIGLGGYFGSIEKPVYDDSLMRLRGGNGLSVIAKMGVGINLF